MGPPCGIGGLGRAAMPVPKRTGRRQLVADGGGSATARGLNRRPFLQLEGFLEGPW
jgi:hypothetical protein